ncbi:hypothetical protein PIB30_083178 [Stylosanthes scabra]|uniref:Secreted protein n=1 Tax=Stylosanthes scabra TaxID=79078 RepID=A0ABU6YPT7_9FABA|nr:hypothetical protein [Stylosanthes scabra]
MTSGWFMLLVVCLISSEEKAIAGGGFPARGLGMTSTARHESLLHFAAFLDGGFPSSGIPPEIIAISRFVPRSLGSSFRLSGLGSGLPCSIKSRRSRHSSVSCPCYLWYLQYECRTPLLVFFMGLGAGTLST